MPYLRAVLNVGHGREQGYVRRYQRALDAVLATCEPHAATGPVDLNEQTGSDYSRGYRAAMHALSTTLIAEMSRHLIEEEQEATP